MTLSSLLLQTQARHSRRRRSISIPFLKGGLKRKKEFRVQKVRKIDSRNGMGREKWKFHVGYCFSSFRFMLDSTDPSFSSSRGSLSPVTLHLSLLFPCSVTVTRWERERGPVESMKERMGRGERAPFLTDERTCKEKDGWSHISSWFGFIVHLFVDDTLKSGYFFQNWSHPWAVVKFDANWK